MEKNYRAELVGVLGDPVDGNPTGVMEEAGFEHDGLNWRYITVKVLPEDLDAAMAGVRAFNTGHHRKRAAQLRDDPPDGPG